MSEFGKSTYRGYLIDHHSPDPPVITLENLTINEYERFIDTARIDNLMVYCKDHWGVTYYNTKIGKRHPGLHTDWVEQISHLLRKKNIEFTAYYCLEYDNHAVITHPEWSILCKDNSPLTCSYSKARWKMPCYETGYRGYALDQIEEIVSNYHPDSLFLDIFGKSLCYCKTCKEKFVNEYGFELPESEEDLIKNNKAVTSFLDDCAKHMLEDILKRVKAIHPLIKVTINFSSLYKKEIRDLLDYQFTEPWAGNWLSAAYGRDTAVNQYPQLGPGDVSEVYNYRNDSIYKLETAKIVANGCRSFLYSGSQHPDGTLEHEESRRVGKAYEDIKKYERFLENRTVIADICIIQSDYNETLRSKEAIAANAITRVKEGSMHREAILGAMKICDYSKYSWQVLPEEQIQEKTLDRYKIVLLPDLYFVSDFLKDQLTKYVENGGVVISTGETSLYNSNGDKTEEYALQNLLGCRFIQRNTEFINNDWSGYLDIADHEMAGYVPETLLPVGDVRIDIENTSGRVLAYYVNPAVAIDDDHWVNWWSPPPKEKTQSPALIENRKGKGITLFFAFNVFTMENKKIHYLKDLISGILDKYIIQPKIILDTKFRNTVKYTAYNRSDVNELIIHQISENASSLKGDIPEISGGSLRLSNNSIKVLTAEIVYPSLLLLKLEKGKDFTSFNLPDFEIHQIIRVVYEGAMDE